MNTRPGRQAAPPAEVLPAGLEALDQLATMVALVDATGACRMANATLEDCAGLARRALCRMRVQDWLTDAAPFAEALRMVAADEIAMGRLEAQLHRAAALGADAPDLPVHVIVSRTDWPGLLLVEMVEIEQQTRLDREERSLEQAQAHKELVRNLAHEIKNPLGGIRGAAQLLEMEIDARELTEYTRVIIHEADRLQQLVDRLLAPHRRPHLVGDVNIHQVCERVRSLILAEFPRGLTLRRDYDTSIPEFRGDREQLIQVLLNLVRNAAQALRGQGRIVLRTRIARQATIAGRRWKLALDLHVIDNGPGVPEEIGERIFYPLVSGREGGTGLGLTLAQTFVQQHGGLIECESRPGVTDFRILLPLPGG